MSLSDLDIARAAHQWIAQHGDDANAKVREMVEAMREWRLGRCIIVAIGTLGAPPTGARH